MRFQDPLIVGAGPAGCAAALRLAQLGARATLIERSIETGDAICGGFLSWRTLNRLERLGVTGLGGHAIGRVCLFSGSRTARAHLPAAGMGVSRHRLDTVMQAMVAVNGTGFERGVTVREIEGLRLRTDAGERLPDALFLATGKHDVRGAARPRDGDDPTLGLRLRLTPNATLSALVADAIELHLFDRGYIGLLLQEDGSGNLCLAVRKSRLAESGGSPARLIAEIARGTPLADRMAHIDAAPDVDAIAAVPYGWRTGETIAGVFRLGDQAAVIPSLAGEGIGIAVASGIAAADAWTRGGAEAAPRYQRDFARRTARPVKVAQALWELGERPVVAHRATTALAHAPWLVRTAARLTRIGD